MNGEWTLILLFSAGLATLMYPAEMVIGAGVLTGVLSSFRGGRLVLELVFDSVQGLVADIRSERPEIPLTTRFFAFIGKVALVFGAYTWLS